MSDSPDVSVVMSVYNGAEYLRETLDSVLAQEDVELELIVINDGSTDQSVTILEEYATRDERVRVFQQENQGLTRSLIRGCSEARGKYIARQDVGDVSERRRLLLQKSVLDESSDLAFVSSWTEFCGPKWEFLYLVKGSGVATSPTNIISEAERHGVIDFPTCHPSVMFRKASYDSVGGYRSEFYYGQDWDLWYRLAEGAKFQTIQRPLYKARILLDSISARQKAGQNEIAAFSRAALRQRLSGLSEQEVLHRARLIRPQEARVSSGASRSAGQYFIGECLRRNGDDRALVYFKQAIGNSPLFVKAWIRILQHKLGGSSTKRATSLSTE